jgi:hypothetical protein
MGAVPSFSITKDVNGLNAYGTRFVPNEYQYQVGLAAAAEQTLTVPNNVDTAIFSYTSPTVWVGTGSTPINLPTLGFTQTPAVLNHAVKEVVPGETLRFISSVVAEVGVVFFNRSSQ